MAYWWSGGPEDVQTHQPGLWFLMTSGMRACLQVTDPPLNPLGMLGTCSSLAAIPIWGTAITPGLYAYADYYCAAYAANPPATETGVPVVYTLPADFDPIPAQVNDIWAYVKVQNSRMYSLVNEWTAFKAQWDWFYTHAEYNADDEPIPAATNKDTARMLAAIYYTNWLFYNNPVPMNADEVLAAITAAQNAINGHTDTQLGTTETSINNNTDAEAVLVKADIAGIQSLSEATVQGIINAAVGTLTGEVGEAAQLVLDALALLDGGSASGYPGAADVTLGDVTNWSEPIRVDAAMDGCLVTLASMPAGTGRAQVGGMSNWLHAGWLAFLADDGLADEIQYLNLNSAVYVPKRLASATGVLLFPRASASGTIRPWSKTV